MSQLRAYIAATDGVTENDSNLNTCDCSLEVSRASPPLSLKMLQVQCLRDTRSKTGRVNRKNLFWQANVVNFPRIPQSNYFSCSISKN